MEGPDSEENLRLQSPGVWMKEILGRMHEDAHPPSLLNPLPLENLVRDGIDWRQLHRNVENGELKALIVAALYLGTSQTTLFVEHAKDEPLLSSQDPRRRVRPGRIDAEEVLASAALPILFPQENLTMDTTAMGVCVSTRRFRPPFVQELNAWW
ncbi:MAG: hypothetical protein R3C68_03010 [Myxococcota bacterium]